MAVQRVQRQKLMFELLEAHPLMMASMLNWADMRPGPLQRWSKYIGEIRFDPMEAMFGHLWSDPNSDFCKAFEPVNDVCRQILEILTRVGEPIKTAAQQFIDPLNEAIVTPAPPTYPPHAEGEFDVNRDPKAEKDPDAAPAMPLNYIIAYFEQLLETAELEGAANRGELDADHTIRPDRVNTSWKTPALRYSPMIGAPAMRSPEPALPLEPLNPVEHTPHLAPAPLQPLANASEIHDDTVRSIGDPILDLQIEECLEVVNGLMMQDPRYHAPPPDR